MLPDCNRAVLCRFDRVLAPCMDSLRSRISQYKGIKI